MTTIDEILDGINQTTRSVFGGVPISRDDLVAGVRRQLAGLWKPIARQFIFAGDGLYACPTEAELMRILAASLQDRPAYLASVMDCDDFAWRLKVFANEQARAAGKAASYALGVVWRTDSTRARQGHAYNWALLHALKGGHALVMIEPQTGDYRPLDRTVDRNLDLVCC